MSRPSLLFVFAALLLVAFPPPARGMAQRVYPLGEMLRISQAVVRGQVVARDDKNLRLAFAMREPLKGDVPFRWMDVDLRPGGWVGPGELLRRVAPGLPVLLFASRIRERWVVLVFTEGTWFQVSAPDAKNANRLAWTLTRGDPLLRRTFAGTTSALEKIVGDVVAGRAKAPDPNPGATGLGPEVPAGFKPAAPVPPLPPFLAARYGSAATVAKIAAPPADDKTAFATLPVTERPVAEGMAREFAQPAAVIAALYRQAGNDARDVRMALTYSRDFGRGGNRAYVRGPEEILALKREHDRLTWLDIKGCLQRAGELFRPVDDSAQLIAGLRARFPWDELDPLFNDDKWQKRNLDEVIAQWRRERLPHPLLPGDRLRGTAYVADFGRVGLGGPQMESVGWSPLPGAPPNLARRQFAWDGKDGTGGQAPGRLVVRAPDSMKGEMPNRPPRPGLPFAGAREAYGGAALWLANGVGDYAGHNANPEGAFAYYDAGWVVVPARQSRAWLADLQIFTPDHSDEVGEPRDGWYNGSRRGSRYVAVGVRVADGKTRAANIGPPTLLVNVEPAPDRWDRVLLRVDVKPGQVTLIAFIAGIGEIGRATAKVDANADVAVAPLVGIRRPGQGFVPELYVGGLKVSAIGDGPLAVAKGVPVVPPAPPVVAAQAPIPPTAPPLRLPAGPGPERVILVIDHSSSMQPHLARARIVARGLIAALRPKDSVIVAAMDADTRLLGDAFLSLSTTNRELLSGQLEGIGAGAGTNYAVMLEKALATKPTILVLITDGQGPSQGATDVAALLRLKKERNQSRTTVHVVALSRTDPLPDAGADRRLAESTGGRTFVLAP